MRTAAVTRRKLRRWAGTVSVSAGTAVFSGAVAIIVDSVVQGGTIHWPYLAGSTALGAALSGGGAWLLATVRSAVGISLAAMDHAGDIERYQDETDSFARFGRGIFTAQTSVQVTVETPADLKSLRARLRAALRTLHEIEQRARQTGLLFQGRPEVGFHVGRWLNQAGGIDLYSDARHGGPGTHFAAIRLTPAISAPPRHLDRAVYHRTETGFSEAPPSTSADLPRLLSEHTDTCLGLAINLNGPIDEAGFTGPVLASAAQEGATVVMFLALPAPADDPDAPGRQLASSREEYESTVAAILAAARHMRAAPGLVYLKTPAVIPVALGRYLYGKDWIPMRHHRDDPRPVKYDRFSDTSHR
ncbi:MAG TPA: hypothetical protein VMV92_29320 [Streptosporangiaceae bacterium]|nr:hypothetical protein [Streptosporangiaceae bacterium]